MNEGIGTTQFEFEKATKHYKGKVRELYEFDNKIVMIATDRISAFDVILPNPIPYKGQILNEIATFFLKSTQSIVPNWYEQSPHPNVTIGKKCTPFPIEIIVRKYLAGHAWRTYQKGKRRLCGVPLPPNLRENDELPTPIITPTTKSQKKHDEDIDKETILKQKWVTEEEYETIEKYALQLFDIGTEMAQKRGLLLVDTKYEFGKYENEIVLIDEIHTPDSSRYFYLDTYNELQKKGLPQKQLSKEFVRKWLMENGFDGQKNQKIPSMTAQKITEISNRYIELYEKITHKTFVKDNYLGKLEKIKQSIINALQL